MFRSHPKFLENKSDSQISYKADNAADTAHFYKSFTTFHIMPLQPGHSLSGYFITTPYRALIFIKSFIYCETLLLLTISNYQAKKEVPSPRERATT